MSNLDRALDLARLGFAVHPLLPRSKLPATQHAHLDATTNPAIITTWSDAGNLGIACSASRVEGHPILALDIDPRHGGDKSLTELLGRLGPLPRTVEVRTGTGGTHYYFRGDPKLQYRGQAAPGIDVKFHGYVVAPQSIHPDTGLAYEWVHGPLSTPIAVLPQLWLGAIVKPVVIRTAAPLLPLDPIAASKYGLAAIERELEAVRNAPAGNRDNTLNVSSMKLAQLFAAGIIGDMRPSLRNAGLAAGLEERETDATIASGWRKGLTEPRRLPRREERPRL